MADDRRRIVTTGPAGTTVLQDLENGADFVSERDSFAVVPSTPSAILAESQRRYGGQIQVGETNPPGLLRWTMFVRGDDADEALANAEGIFAVLRSAVRGMLYEWRPAGATASVFYDIEGAASITPTYRSVVFRQVKMMSLAVEIPVNPLALLAPMDLLDDFSVDRLTEYVADAGVISTDVALSGGSLIGAGTLTTERRLVHTDRGHDVLDAEILVEGVVGSTVTSFKLGGILRRSAADTYLEGYVDDNGTNTRIRVDKVVAGARTNLGTVNLGARLTAGERLWVRFRTEGELASIEHFTTEPQIGDNMGGGYPIVAITEAELPAGKAGLVWTPQHAGASVAEWRCFPYTYHFGGVPQRLRLGTVPGTAPALADVMMRGGATGGMPFALMAWAPRPAPWNLVWNGDLETDGDGWDVAAVTGVQAAAGSTATRNTTAARCKYGAANLQIVTPASSGAGANFPLRQQFRQGRTYTALLWASAASATTQMVLKLGVNGDVATSAAAALTTTPALYTVTWTPTSFRDGAHLSFQTNAATGTTCNIDGVVVYEGTVAPTFGRHAEGAGAMPPFGIIEAEAADTGDITGTWAIGSDGSASLGTLLTDASTSGETYEAGWWIDPGLMAADPFASSIDVEVWGRFQLGSGNVTPRAIVSARPEQGTDYGAERFTAEFGSAGRALVAPSSGTAFRWSRLGVLNLPVDPARPARWKMWLKATTSGGSSGAFGFDCFHLVPAQSRACSPTGRAADATYPKFIAVNVTAVEKTITSDLRGYAARSGYYGAPDPGLGGAPIELPAGAADLFVMTSNTVPDDPSSISTSAFATNGARLHIAVTPRVHAFGG